MNFLRPLLFLILLLTISFSFAQEDENTVNDQGEEVGLTESSPYQTGDIDLETPQPYQTNDIDVDDATNTVDDNGQMEEE